MLKQHVGEIALPSVIEGDKVNKGQPLANVPNGKMGSIIHSSIDGTVTEVTSQYIIIKR